MWKNKIKMIANVLLGLVIIFGILTFYNTFSMDTEYKFESMVYDIDDNYIKNISSNTSIELYLKYFDLDNCSIEVVDKDNKKIVDGFVYNGSKTVLYDSNGTAIKSYINIIKGDYNSDGIIDTNDFNSMGKCLIDGCSMDEYLLMSADIDGDSEFHINDLVLLDSAVTLGYTNLSLKEDSIILQSNEKDRLVAKVEPNYGVNLNVKWTSLDNNVVTVDDAGRVTGNKEGETKILVSTLDGKYTEEVIVKVDNTIQLESYNGIAYVGGNDLIVKIKSIDYEGITCTVDNEEYAGCEINDNSLVLRPKAVGKTKVTVTSSKYGKVVYDLDVQSVYLNVMPKYICGTPGNSKLITVSGFNSGDLSFEAEDKEIVANAYMTNYQNRKMLKIDFGNKQGRTNLKVIENHANTSNIVVVDVTYMTLSHIGTFAKVGEEVTVTAKGDNLGTITCKSNDLTKGTCRVEGNNIIVTPLAKGEVTVDVYNNFSYESYTEVCNQSQFIVVIQE